MATSLAVDANSETAGCSRRKPAVQSLDRGLVILESVAKSGHPVSLAELAELIGIDRSSAFRLADTLRQRGFLACPGPVKGYVLGPAIWRCAQACDWSQTLIRIARPQLRWLANQTGETAHLAVREGDRALFIDTVLGNHLLTVSGQVGEQVPLYCTAHGKALLADYDEVQLKRLLGERPLKSYTQQTNTSIEKLAGICEQVRSQGFVLDEADYQEALRCLAAPVRDAGGSVIGSIGISAPASRMPQELRGVRASQVVKAAMEIQTALSVPARRSSSSNINHRRGV